MDYVFLSFLYGNVDEILLHLLNRRFTTVFLALTLRSRISELTIDN